LSRSDRDEVQTSVLEPTEQRKRPGGKVLGDDHGVQYKIPKGPKAKETATQCTDALESIVGLHDTPKILTGDEETNNQPTCTQPNYSVCDFCDAVIRCAADPRRRLALPTAPGRHPLVPLFSVFFSFFSFFRVILLHCIRSTGHAFTCPVG
jgi:hypothetical protein